MSTQFAVDILFKTLGVEKLKTVERQLQGVVTTTGRLKRQKPLTGIGASAATASGQVRELNAALTKTSAIGSGASFAGTANNLTALSAASKAGASSTALLAAAQTAAAASGGSFAAEMAAMNAQADRLEKAFQLTNGEFEQFNDLVDGGATKTIDVTNAVKKLEPAMGGLAKSTNKVSDAQDKASSSTKKIGEAADKAKGKVTGLSGQVKKLAAAYLTAAAAQKALQIGLNRLTSQDRLRALTRQYGEFSGAQAAASRAASKFNISQTEANTEFGKLYARLRPLGLSLNQVEDAYQGIFTAIKVGSLDAGGASSLITQVGQALGTGRVQAEELNTVLEQSPLLAKAIADELGTTVGQLKTFAREGKLSSEQVFKGLLRVKEEGADVLSEALDTPAQKIIKFGNKTQDVVAALTEAVIPEFTDALGDVSKGFDAIIKIAQYAGRIIGLAFRTATQITGNFAEMLSRIVKGDFSGAANFAKALVAGIPAELQKTFETLDFRTLKGVDVKGAAERRRKREAFPNMFGGGTGNGNGTGTSGTQPIGTVIEALTGDRSSPFYRKDHGGSNYHVHLAFASPAEKEFAKSVLKNNGIQIGSENDGKHASGSYHYSNQAFDVPASQVPVGQEDALSQKVFSLLGSAGFGGVIGNTGLADIFAQARVESDNLRASSLETWSSIEQSVLGTNSALQAQVTDLNEVNRLIMEGMDPARAQQQVEGQRALLDIEIERKEVLKQLNELKGLTPEENAEKEQQINEYYRERVGLQAQLNKLQSAQPKEKGKIQKKIEEYQAQLNDTEGMIVSLAGTIEGEIGSAMSNAITGLIDGTQTAEEAFSNMFKNIGKAFIDMATQMIAKALVMKALGLLTGGSGWAPTGGWGSFGSVQFADGGHVSGPTPAVVGEGGSDEYIIPANKMGSAMSRWNSGLRGDSVTNGADPTGGAEGGFGAEIQPPVFKMETTVINGVEYATVAQMQQMGASAAAHGARQGQAMTIRRLQMNPGARRKIGL